MIIDQCRKLALRAPARVVFPDALDVRVLKAAHYLQQQGLAHPILVASPFALRQFALGERLPLTGVQVIDPHSNLAMREAFAAAWQARAGDQAPADAVDKLADVPRGDGQRRAGRGVYRRKSLVNRQRAARWSAPYRPAAGV